MTIIVSDKTFSRAQYGLTASLALKMNNNAKNLYIYSGTMPGTAEGFAPASYTGQLLVTFANASYVCQTDIIKFETVSSATATGTGTATWFANCSNNNGYVIISDSVGVIGDNKILILSTLSINSGNTINPIDFGLRFYQT